MASEDGSIEQAAAARQEMLRALRAAQELLNTPDEDSVQAEDKKNDQKENGEETWVYPTISVWFLITSQTLYLLSSFYFLVCSWYAYRDMYL